MKEDKNEVVIDKDAVAMVRGQRKKSKSQNISKQNSVELYLEAENEMDFRGYLKEQMKKLIMLMKEELASAQLSKNNISSEKQSKLDGVQLFDYNITHTLESNCTED